MAAEENIFHQPQQPIIGGQKKAEVGMPVGPTSEEVNDINVRVRLLEERFGNLHRKILLTDQNMLSNSKKVFTEIKSINDEISDIKNKMSEIVDKFQLVIKEMQTFSKKSDLETLKKYLALWEPTKFVTSEQVEKMIEESSSKKDIE